MPPKSKKVHNTRSVLGARSRSNSPLVVKVNNDLVKAKQPKQSKAKPKSIVKVVNNNASKVTKRVAFCQGPAPPADQQPALQPAEPQRQTTFADAMAKWKLSMVATINSCPIPPGDKDNQSPQGNDKFLQASKTVVPERSRADPLPATVHSPPAVVASGSSNSGAGARHSIQDSHDIPQQIPPSDDEQDFQDAETDMEMDPGDNPPPPPAGRPNGHPGVAASSPQGALDMMSDVQQVRDQQGKRIKPILSKHVPDNIRR